MSRQTSLAIMKTLTNFDFKKLEALISKLYTIVYNYYYN